MERGESPKNHKENGCPWQEYLGMGILPQIQREGHKNVASNFEDTLNTLQRWVRIEPKLDMGKMVPSK